VIDQDEIRRNFILALKDLEEKVLTCSQEELDKLFGVGMSLERNVMLDSWHSSTDKSKKQRVMKVQVELMIL